MHGPDSTKYGGPEGGPPAKNGDFCSIWGGPAPPCPPIFGNPEEYTLPDFSGIVNPVLI